MVMVANMLPVINFSVAGSVMPSSRPRCAKIEMPFSVYSSRSWRFATSLVLPQTPWMVQPDPFAAS
ncbi:hypothetical protein D3C87_1724320 [compost metagenome]